MEYDIIVLGGGPGGYLAAERAGQAQKKVLCIEEAHLGGTCLNEGCIPTKTLLYSGKLYAHAKHSQAYGVHAKDVTLDHSAVIDRKEQVIRTLVGGVGATLKACHVDVVDAKASSPAAPPMAVLLKLAVKPIQPRISLLLLGLPALFLPFLA